MSETSFIPTKDKAYTSFQLLQGLKAVLHREEFRIAWFPNSLLNPEGMWIWPALWVLFGGSEAEKPPRNRPEKVIHGTLRKGLAN